MLSTNLIAWACPMFSEKNKSPISLNRVEWFCWFFASMYLHLVRYPLKLQKYAIFCGIVRHTLSANQIVRCFKIKKLKNDMRYQVDFLVPLKLEKILSYFYLWPQNTLGQSVCRIFYFCLVWLNTGGTLLHCTCCFIYFCCDINYR